MGLLSRIFHRDQKRHARRPVRRPTYRFRPSLQILDEREVPSDRLDDRVTAAAFIRPGLADQYRHAHQVFVDIESEKSDPSHEHDQRMAFLVYRELIVEHTKTTSADDDAPIIEQDGLRVTTAATPD